MKVQSQKWQKNNISKRWGHNQGELFISRELSIWKDDHGDEGTTFSRACRISSSNEQNHERVMPHGCERYNSHEFIFYKNKPLALYD